MIIYDNKEFRNLVEQVQYLTDYHDVNQGLVQWGIKVVGQVENASDLPMPYDGDYGDAIAVGTEAPFFFYIWTRASIEGDPAYWFPFGEISIVGPQGPEGPQGKKGDTGESTKWLTGSMLPSTSAAKENDLFLNITNGNVYQLSNESWVLKGNIRGSQGVQGPTGVQGPQGIQGPVGPKGDTGDTGGLVNIAGILDNMNQLPTPASLNNLTIAYLVGTSDPRDLYIQVGTDPATAQWQDIGPINTATLVFVNGEAQNIWDADTKIDKPAAPSQPSVIVQLANGTITQVQYGRTTPIAYTIPTYLVNGQLPAGEPTADNHAVNKSYADGHYVAKSTTTSAVYSTDGSGNPLMLKWASNNLASSLMLRDGNGNVSISDPTQDAHAVNKSYAEANFLSLSGGTMTGEIVVGQGDNKGINLGKAGVINSGNSTVLGFLGGDFLIGSYQIPTTIRTSAEKLKVQIGQSTVKNIATEDYVDNTEKYNEVELNLGVGTVVDTSTLTTSKVYKLDLFTNRDTKLVKTDSTEITIENPVEIIGTLRYVVSYWVFQGYAVKSDNTVFTFSETNMSQVKISDLSGLTPYYRLVEIT